MGVGVHRAAADLVVCRGERAVLAEGVALEGRGFPVEVEVRAMTQTEVLAAGEYEREVGITVAVAVGHPAAEERHRRIKEGLAAEVLRLREAAEEVAELFDRERVVVRELLHVTGIASVVAELVAGFGDADLGDGEGVALAAEAERGYAGSVRLEGEDHQVVDRAEVIAGLGGRDVAIGPLAIGVGDLGQRGVEPDVGTAGADLGLAHGGEVLVHAAFIFATHLLLELADFREVGVEDAALAAQFTALDGLTAFRFFEEGGENFAAATHRRQAHTISGPGEGILRQGDLHRARAGVLGGDFGHLLVHRDGITVRRAKLAAGQPGADAVVVVAEAASVVQAADWGDGLTVLLERLERAGELVVRAVLGDLVVERMNAVREVDEGAALGRGGHLLGGAQREHALQHGQGDEGAHRAQGVTAVDEPGLGEVVGHKVLSSSFLF